jgi:phosphoribosylpyrophosphate synthetase
VVVTDTLSIKEGCDKITVLTSADLIAEVIHRVQNYKSISSLFNLSKKK